jgi:predicted DNA-binding WGR domain protein
VRVEFTTRSRGYVLTLERDLFGAFILYRRWFGLHNRRGGIKQQIFLDQDSALREFHRVEKTRARRGYIPVSGQPSASSRSSAVFSGTGSLAVD